MATVTDLNRYWVEREREHYEKQVEDDKKIHNRLAQKYREAQEEIQKEIEAFYGRYATNEGISMAEARKRVTKLDIERYEKKAKRYVKERNFTDRANEEMRLYNVTMRINRLELLRKNIELELLGLTSYEEMEFQRELTKHARDEFERLAGILGDSVLGNEQHIFDIVNSSFLSATWSDRIWNNQNALRSELDKLLNRGIVQGIHPRRLARELREEFDVGIFNSERLLITEFARVQADVFQSSMEEAEIEEYEFIAEPTACPICSALDGRIFRLEDMEIGVNMYPIHPFCRCSVSGHLSREALMKEFDERGLFPADEEAPKVDIPKKYDKPEDAYSSIRLTNIDEEYQESMKEKLLDLQNTYPVAEKEIKVTTTKANGAFGWYRTGMNASKRKGVQYGQFERRLNFSNTLMTGDDRTVGFLKQTYPEHLADTIEKSRGLMVVDHEYGHTIDFEYILKKNPEILERANKFRGGVRLTNDNVEDFNYVNRRLRDAKPMSQVIKEKMMKDYNLEPGKASDERTFTDMIREEYGDYATTDVKEFLAEGFAVARNHENPSEFTRNFMKHFDAEYDDAFGGGS